MCEVLACVAIKLPGCIGTTHLSTALLNALSHLALGWATGDKAAQKVTAALRGVCCVPYQIPVRHRCEICETRATAITQWDCCYGDRKSWDAFVDRACGNTSGPVPALQDLCLDAMRRHEMERVSLKLADVVPYQTEFCSLPGARRTPTPRQCVRESLHHLITARCSHKTLCHGVLDGCNGDGHCTQQCACPEAAMEFLLESINSYLQQCQREDAPTPPPPAYESPESEDECEEHDSEDIHAWWSRKDRERERLEDRARARIWAPFAFP